jgi:hypothetical protein
MPTMNPAPRTAATPRTPSSRVAIAPVRRAPSSALRDTSRSRDSVSSVAIAAARADRQTAAEALSEAHDVRHDAGSDGTEERAAPAEAGPDLVGDEQCPTFAREQSERLEKPCGRNDDAPAPEDRFD